MASQYKTPGVYIVEKDAFPNSVVEVATAVPAFIGHTETAMNGSGSLHDTPTRLTSLAEFQAVFGSAPTPLFEIKPTAALPNPSPLSDAGADSAPALPPVPISSTQDLIQSNPAYCLYGAMRLFFENGGGPCYVTSIGGYGDPFDADRMIAAITGLEKEAEPTLLVIPETTRLSRADAKRVLQAMLAHCGDRMRDRFAILDISSGHLPQSSALGDPVATFRNDIGNNWLGFGAGYYPWLNTTIWQDRDFTFENISPASHAELRKLLIAEHEDNAAFIAEINKIGAPELVGDFTITVPLGGQVIVSAADISATDEISTAADLRFEILDTGQMPGALVATGTDTALTSFTQQELEAGAVSFVHDKDAATTGQFAVIVTDKDGLATLLRTVLVLAGEGAAPTSEMQGKLRGEISASVMSQQMLDKTLRGMSRAYVKITGAMAAALNIMPPAAAMAGLYTMVDNSRGVWKAPANVSVNAVTSPTVTINHEQQEDLNVTTTGKSINAIRSFVGEGTLVWGARTLDGNSLDWRYVPVRRTMIMIEQSIRLAVKAYVFEPNDASTWLTIRAMIENFLTGVWKQGGLAGAVPAEAFGVQVGLGETMTPEDIIEGTLRVTVLVAVTRPAEFIEITFQQQMQRS
ncbi:Cadherin-like [Roseovarius marisflavi]|uniref:Cadherin-like n=1 Tax=Roseovarius marisflavi TaxID=1054996 RepID=A0A1M6ZBH1_9RHOB|nr:cadherin-like domain-containing protein [Roseovarius marisflavi]SHL27705.1 Cadherin-like [Roseovarius marisflavi]